jgi:hypothetical protein
MRKCRPNRSFYDWGSNRWTFNKNAILVVLAATVFSAAATAQIDVQSLAERSAIIVRGKILRTNASDEPMLEASRKTAVITIEQMIAGSEVAGNQTGRTATVIFSERADVKAGEEAFFFGNPRFLGKSLTMIDEGEVPAQAGQSMPTDEARRRPVRARLAAASLVFRGTVQNVRPVEKAASAEQDKRTAEAPSEHDPEWNVATVKIATPLKGGVAGQEVSVVFAASRDITWFNSPKLKTGQDAVFLAHPPDKQKEVLYRSTGLLKLIETGSVYLVTKPFDVLPPADEELVRGLLAAQKETKQ